MKVGNIAKSIKDIKKIPGVTKSLLAILLSLSTVMPFNCDKPVPKNEAPDTEITSRQFNDKGEVEYGFLGTDSESYVDHISVSFNGGNYQNFSNNSLVSVPIREGSNTAEATAYDDEGKADPTPAIDTFISPTEEQARTLIDNILSGRSGTYGSLEEDVLVSIGASDNFYIDYLIKRDNKPDAMVNYVEHGEDLGKELLNKQQLDLYGIPNLYLIRVPESEINLKLNDFIDNGYN